MPITAAMAGFLVAFLVIVPLSLIAIFVYTRKVRKFHTRSRAVKSERIHNGALQNPSMNNEIEMWNVSSGFGFDNRVVSCYYTCMYMQLHASELLN